MTSKLYRTFAARTEAEALALLRAWCAKRGREVPPYQVNDKGWCVEVSFVEREG